MNICCDKHSARFGSVLSGKQKMNGQEKNKLCLIKWLKYENKIIVSGED